MVCVVRIFVLKCCSNPVLRNTAPLIFSEQGFCVAIFRRLKVPYLLTTLQEKEDFCQCKSRWLLFVKRIQCQTTRATPNEGFLPPATTLVSRLTTLSKKGWSSLVRMLLIVRESVNPLLQQTHFLSIAKHTQLCTILLFLAQSCFQSKHEMKAMNTPKQVEFLLC